MPILLKLLLSPFSILYGLITFVRNKLYDFHLLSSKSFNLPVISAGNISAGGTGKSPLIELLIRILQKENIKVATLSRGYGRKTKGFYLATKNSTAQTIGDEPLQFYHKFDGITVSVCENRVKGIEKLLRLQPSPQCILLDDAYQHRRVKPGLNILLTDYSKLYIYDSMLPSGRLREFPVGANRADIIIITKAPENISEEEKQALAHRHRTKKHQEVFVSFISYGNLIPIFKNQTIKMSDLNHTKVLLFTGIANATPLENYLKKHCAEVVSMRFSDHHLYTINDIKQIIQKFHNFADDNNMIITTEKDIIRLVHHADIDMLNQIPLYYIPIEMDFAPQDYHLFEQKILHYVRKN